jgi:hypothetical protein
MNRERRGPTVDEESSLDHEQFGCPMLTRNHGEVPRGIRRPGFRCSLGWALHDDSEVDRCREIETVPACWKAHPDRLLTLSPARASSSNGHTHAEQKT